MSLGIVFLSEVFGTAMLTLLGCGVVANVALKGTKGNSGGFLMVTWGWGIAVFSGVYVAAQSGAHLNPAVTLGLLINGKDEYAPDVPVDAVSTLVYFGGLEDVVAAAAAALRPGGVFIFTVEEATSPELRESYGIQSHGRYHHSAMYVERVLRSQGLEPVIERGELRLESGLPVRGLVVRAGRPGRRPHA